MNKVIFVACFSFFNINLHSQNWQQFGSGTHDIYSLYSDTTSNTLYALGKFIDANNDTVLSPAYWNGSAWILIGNFDFSNSNLPRKLFKYDNTLFIGGYFTKSLGAPGNFILKLNNNNTWDTLDFSPDGGVDCFADFQTRLFIGGGFNTFGPLWSIGVIINNGPFWSTIPPFAHLARITSMCQYNNRLVIGGSFSSDLTLNYQGGVVEWDGINILPMADGLELDNLILDSEVYDGKLYVAGLFNAHNVTDGNRIVSWDGMSWGSVGGGVNNNVTALQVYNGELYAAGSFWIAGGIPADCIAKWDGIKWCSLGSVINGSITDMCVFNNELIIVGTFTSIDGQNVNHIARWTGGNFSDSCQVVGIEEINQLNHISIFPSPTHDLLKIKNESLILANLKIVEPTGKVVFTIVNNKTDCSIDISFLKNGLYIVIIDTNHGRSVKKFIKH